MPLLAIFLLLPLLVVILIPVALVRRIGRGTMRRRARGWVVTVNLVAVVLSTMMFLIGALISNAWAPDALRYSLAGLATGMVLGLLGIVLTRWELAHGVMHYTPNRWLVLAVTAVVAARLIYGIWRVGEVWSAGAGQVQSVAASSLAMSMAAGAVVLGYYLVYWLAVSRRLRVLRDGVRP